MVLAHRAEKWCRFSLTRTSGSALNDAPAKKTSIGWIPKVASTFGSDVSTIQEAPVPTLFRFLLVVAILAGLGFAAMFALATFVKPDPREITVPVSTSRTSSSS
jgi:hypothetical protein